MKLKKIYKKHATKQQVKNNGGVDVVIKDAYMTFEQFKGATKELCLKREEIMLRDYSSVNLQLYNAQKEIEQLTSGQAYIMLHDLMDENKQKAEQLVKENIAMREKIVVLEGQICIDKMIAQQAEMNDVDCTVAKLIEKNGRHKVLEESAERLNKGIGEAIKEKKELYELEVDSTLTPYEKMMDEIIKMNVNGNDWIDNLEDGLYMIEKIR